MATNNFKAFALDPNANVMSQADWEALPALLSGFTAGKASSAQVNKAIRQATTISALIGQFIANTGTDALDNGDVSALVTKFISALNKTSQPLDATLTALAALTGAVDKLPYFNGADTAALTALTAVGRDIIGKSSIADVLTYLGLGGIASLRQATFAASGSWTCPAGVTQISIDACGAGGGGGAGASGAAGGAGGGGGAAVIGQKITVIPGTVYTITIGTGGTGGISSSTTGGTGGSTSFGTLLTLLGGGGGGRTAGGSAGGTGGKVGEVGYYAGSAGVSFAGAGGGCFLGGGGVGGSANMTGVTPGQFGGGGGGGAGSSIAGGAGADGYMRITW